MLFTWHWWSSIHIFACFCLFFLKSYLIFMVTTFKLAMKCAHSSRHCLCSMMFMRNASESFRAGCFSMRATGNVMLWCKREERETLSSLIFWNHNPRRMIDVDTQRLANLFLMWHDRPNLGKAKKMKCRKRLFLRNYVWNSVTFMTWEIVEGNKRFARIIFLSSLIFQTVLRSCV